MATVVWIASHFHKCKAQGQVKDGDSSQSPELPPEQVSPGPTTLLLLHLLQLLKQPSRLLVQVLSTLLHALQCGLIQPIPGLLRVQDEAWHKQEKERNG